MMFWKQKDTRPHWEVMADDGMNKFLKFCISCVFLWVVWTLYEPVLAISDISPAVSERILSRHELVSDKIKCSCSHFTFHKDFLEKYPAMLRSVDQHSPSLEA